MLTSSIEPPRALLLLALGALVGCGGRTGTLDDPPPDADVQAPRPERCNLLDDDLDGQVDEDFTDPDASGLYVDDLHCGACGRPCGAPTPPERGLTCRLVEGVPTCAATACADGFGVSRTGRCVPFPGRFCLPCRDDGDCGDLAGAACADVGGETRCVVDCAGGCPEGTVCRGDDDVCVPAGGSCSCSAGDAFDLACLIRDPEGAACVGAARCEDGVQTACVGFVERCNGGDDDCDALVDEDFVDGRGVYRRDPAHCGACGVSCLEATIPEGDLVCGGDPFAPSCVLDCPDVRDGRDPGDRVDADREVANGCECTIGSLVDAPGPPGASGEALDVDCDGADGEVVRSLYVAPDGDDDGPGSPSRPLRTISEGLRRAAESLDGADPRPRVFVAGGLYGEVLRIPDGVEVFGGYRRDFLALEPDGFRTEVRATDDGPFGAALVTEPGAGERPTGVTWMAFQGRDATLAGEATVGAIVDRPGSELRLEALEIRAGLPGEGTAGSPGDDGDAPTRNARAGAPPRAAREDMDRDCNDGAANRVDGGAGGANRCPGGIEVDGGAGGDAICPEALGFPPRTQPEGDDGGSPGAGTPAGTGGQGGMDARGPIVGGFGCADGVCCGLADFTVPSGFEGPRPGARGADGRSGTPGAACEDPLGRFAGAVRWTPGTANAGTDGRPGAGGGGGGAGGGAEMQFFEDTCPFPDGLGGGGGGGGAGGCGGRRGRPGTSGGASVGIVVIPAAGRDARLPEGLRDLDVRPAPGARGGDGGAGGEGGRGGAGAAGGSIPRADRTTPTLAGPAGGAAGGDGGNGGAGGGGGGGCGGSSVGIWVVSGSPLDPEDERTVDRWLDASIVSPGPGGGGGRGGGGPAAGQDGADGVQLPLVVR